MLYTALKIFPDTKSMHIHFSDFTESYEILANTFICVLSLTGFESLVKITYIPLKRHLQCDTSDIRQRWVITTRRISLLLALVLGFASDSCNNNDILLIVGYNY